MSYVEEQAKHLLCLCVCVCVCVTYGGVDQNFASIYVHLCVLYIKVCMFVCARVLCYGGTDQDSAMCTYVCLCVRVCVCVCIYESVHLCKYM